MSIKNILAGLTLSLLTCAMATAGEETSTKSPSRLGVGVHIGFNLGGALPPAVPKPVKKVHAFRPGGAPNLGLDFSSFLYKPFLDRYGSRVRYEVLPVHSQDGEYAYPLSE